MTPNSNHVCGKKHDLHILETYLWKLKSLSKITPKLRTLSDGGISLSSNLSGMWLESLCRCWFVPIIRNYVLSEFNLSLLDFIQTEMSVRQSLRLDIDLCESDCDSSKSVCHQHTYDD